MGKGRYFRLGTGLIAAGAAFIAFGVWFLSTVPWIPSIMGGNAGFIVVGVIMPISGAMVLRDY
jgi:hypothetical protein